MIGATTTFQEIGEEDGEEEWLRPEMPCESFQPSRVRPYDGQIRGRLGMEEGFESAALGKPSV